jgi:hypothetical protein
MGEPSPTRSSKEERIMKPHESVIKVLSALSKKNEQVVLRTWELTYQTCKGNHVDVLVKTATALKIKFTPFSIRIGDRIRKNSKVVKISNKEITSETSSGDFLVHHLTHFLILNITSHS